MKTKKLFNKIVIAILGMMLLIGAGTVINKVVKNNPNTKVYWTQNVRQKYIV